MGERPEKATVVGNALLGKSRNVDREQALEASRGVLEPAGVEQDVAFDPDQQPVLRPAGLALGEQ